MLERNFEILLFEKHVNYFREEIVESFLENRKCEQGVSVKETITLRQEKVGCTKKNICL